MVSLDTGSPLLLLTPGRGPRGEFQRSITLLRAIGRLVAQGQARQGVVDRFPNPLDERSNDVRLGFPLIHGGSIQEESPDGFRGPSLGELSQDGVIDPSVDQG